MGKKRFFYYDPDGNGFTLCDTLEEAKSAVVKILDSCRADAPDGWADDMENICYGEIKGGIVETLRVTKEDYNEAGGEETMGYFFPEGFDELIDYSVEDIPIDPAVLEEIKKSITEVIDLLRFGKL